MKANPDKCHILLRIQKEANFQIVNATIKYSRSKKLLGITLNNELKFDKHIENIYQKVSRRLNPLAKLTNWQILMNSFFKAQFKYCLVVWMFHTRSFSNKIDFCLRISYNNEYSNVAEMLVKVILSPYIILIFTHLQLKCSKLLMVSHQK